MARMELISGIERRRRWSDDAKLRILAEAEQPGACIGDVARRHDIYPAQIRLWRKMFTTFDLPGALVPVDIVDDAGVGGGVERRGPGNGYYQAFYRQICYLTAMRISISMLSPGELQAAIAQRAKQRRLDLELTQAGLAERSGVSLGTLKQFERTGKASLDAVIRLAFALEAEEEFAALFPSRPPQTIDDIVSPRTRQRGRRR